MMLAASTRQQSPRRWQALVHDVSKRTPELLWTGQRTHATQRAATIEAVRKRRELERPQW